jgi:predicted MFS family arabinose efflux permease
VLSLWAAGIAVAAVFVPGSVDGSPHERDRLKLRDFAPRWSDYTNAFDLARAPAMRTVLIITVMRIAASSIQDSFYPVWLKSIGLSATQIGLLITCSSALAAVSSLWVGIVCRSLNPMWVLIWTAFGSILFVSITPALASFALLGAAAALRGVCMGLSQPLMLSILADAAGFGALARGAALRTTANRVAAAMTPICMGSIAGVAGLATSFYAMGAILAAAMGLVALHVKRSPTIAREAAQ